MVRGTFSPARAWRPAVVARLARTLGVAIHSRAMQTRYHYCSTPSFHAAVRSRELWLSSLAQSNDALEGRLVALALARLARRDSLDEHLAGQIQTQVSWFEDIVTGLGFCLSEEADLLSQWRGYAADGTGFAIGYKLAYLEWLATQSHSGGQFVFGLHKVSYKDEEHDALVEPAFQEAKRWIASGAFRPTGQRGLLDPRSEEEITRDDDQTRTATSNASLAVFSLISCLYRLKPYAFREEQEWRLTSMLTRSKDEVCMYRATTLQIIPYRSFSLLEIERQPIDEVLIGPKNPTPTTVVREFLMRNGYGEVNVRRASASYR